MQQSVPQLTRNIAGLNQIKSLQLTEVSIEEINADQTVARVYVPDQNGRGRTVDFVDVRIIGMPGIHAPLDVSNFTGILLGDPKAPIAVMLVEKGVVEFNLSHGVGDALYGTGQPPVKKPVDRVAKQVADTPELQQSREQEPDGHIMVVKPRKRRQKPDDPSRFFPDMPLETLDDPGAYLSASEDEARVIAGKESGIVVNMRSGTTIHGRVNLGASMEDIRIGGAWRLNPMLKFMIPSTAVTPIPTLIYDPPGSKLMAGMDARINSINAAQTQ